jgi:hypothetical protein
MPIHLNDLDVVSEVAGLDSALIVPCNMCPAISVAVKEKQPFMQFFRSFLKSAPFERHIRALQSRLREKGGNLYHQWFLCMWTSGQRNKLKKHAKQYEAVIVLGCDSATETVRDLVKSAKLRFHLPCNVSFEDCKIIPISPQKKNEDMSG